MDDIVERVARAIDEAICPHREGPFGGYDYGHNTEFYGPAPDGGRYVIRDFRTLASKGEWLHQTDDLALHEATLARMTKEHIAKAAIRAVLEGVEPFAYRYFIKPPEAGMGKTIFRTWPDPHLVDDGWTETPLYSLEALKEALK